MGRCLHSTLPCRASIGTELEEQLADRLAADCGDDEAAICNELRRLRRERGVLCTPAHFLACTNLFRIDADGGSLRPLSYGALSEFTPTMIEDGRILYNRWEYVYKGILAAA